MNRFFIIAILFFILSCSKENKTTISKIEYQTLAATYKSHRFKDELTTQQIISRLSNFVSNPDSFAQPKYDVIAYRIFYTTHDYLNRPITASGLVYVPKISNYFVPVICYQHGTIYQKEEVPSISSDLGYYLPFVMASETGSIVCAADYIGLGFSDGVQHYYEPNEEANAVVDMLGSVQILLNKTYRNITFNSEVFLLGYSQGGHATLAAQRKLETVYGTQFQLKGSAPMASFFSFEKSSQLNGLKNNIEYSYPSAYAFLINSIQTTQQIYTDYNTVFIKPYDSLVNVLFDGNYRVGEVNPQFPNYFYSTLQPSFIHDLNNNTNNTFVQALKKYDIINDWFPKTPTHFYHSEDDEVAFYDNSEIAFQTFKQKGGNVELFSLGNVSHLDGNAVAIEKVRNWFYPLIKITPY